MNEKTTKKKGFGIVIALAVAILLGVTVLTVAIISILGNSDTKKDGDGTTLYTLAGVQSTTKGGSDSGLFDFENSGDGESTALNTPQSSSANVGNADAGDAVTAATTKKSSGYDPVKEYEKISKNGENQLSDHHNNKFIKLVSEKYKVDTELLVAIYSEPDTGNNFVLQFSGKRDGDGNVVKSPDTLSKVYLIDKNQKISVATGKTTGNEGVSYAEGTLCFNMVKSIVMPQYPDYFTGVDK